MDFSAAGFQQEDDPIMDFPGPIRDKRWKNVRGSIKPYEPIGNEWERDISKDLIQLDIKVIYRMEEYSARRILSMIDISRATFPMISWSLNDMVISIDEMMNKRDESFT